jgi:hypothetical protein
MRGYLACSIVIELKLTVGCRIGELASERSGPW